MHLRFALPGAALMTLIVVSACGSSSTPVSSSSSSSAPATSTPASSPPAAAVATSTPSAATGATQTGSVVNVGSSSFGPMIIDGQGRTLYLFEADTTTKSTCSGQCAQNWPPFTTTGTPTAMGGAMQSLIGTTIRSDGSTEVTYNGHPLYFFVGDSKPGDTNGEGLMAFGAGWDMLTPAGAKIEKSGS